MPEGRPWDYARSDPRFREKPRTLLEQVFMPAPRTGPQVEMPKQESPFKPVQEAASVPFEPGVKAAEVLRAGPLGAIKVPLPTSEGNLADLVSSIFIPQTRGDAVLAAVPAAKIKSAGNLFRKLEVAPTIERVASMAKKAGPAVRAAEKETPGAVRSLLKAGKYDPSGHVASDLAVETGHYAGAMRNPKTGEVFVGGERLFRKFPDMEPETELYLTRKLGVRNREELQALEDSGQLEPRVNKIIDEASALWETGENPPDWDVLTGDFSEYGDVVYSGTASGEPVFVPSSRTGEEIQSSVRKTLGESFEKLESKGLPVLPKENYTLSSGQVITDDEIGELLGNLPNPKRRKAD